MLLLQYQNKKSVISHYAINLLLLFIFNISNNKNRKFYY